MKIVATSDVHSYYRKIPAPKSADVFIVAGDIAAATYEEAEDFLIWFSTIPVAYKILVAGNNKFLFEDEPAEASYLCKKSEIILLNDSGITIDGIYFWGSSFTPRFCDRAFNRDRESEIAEHWYLMPAETDFLITHGPPFGILDQVDPAINSAHLGCRDLMARVEKLKPRLHFFGHIHGSFGRKRQGATDFFNVSYCDEKFRRPHNLLEIDTADFTD